MFQSVSCSHYLEIKSYHQYASRLASVKYEARMLSLSDFSLRENERTRERKRADYVICALLALLRVF